MKLCDPSKSYLNFAQIGADRWRKSMRSESLSELALKPLAQAIVSVANPWKLSECALRPQMLTSTIAMNCFEIRSLPSITHDYFGRNLGRNYAYQAHP